MPSYRLLSVLLVSACASTGSLGMDPQSAGPRARVSLQPVGDTDARVIPQAIDPQLRRADRLSHVVAARLGSEARVDVRLCVTPAGQVASAELARSSSVDVFDNAVLADVRDWRFEAQPGPETVSSCETTQILYHPHL